MERLKRRAFANQWKWGLLLFFLLPLFCWLFGCAESANIPEGDFVAILNGQEYSLENNVLTMHYTNAANWEDEVALYWENEKGDRQPLSEGYVVYGAPEKYELNLEGYDIRIRYKKYDEIAIKLRVTGWIASFPSVNEGLVYSGGLQTGINAYDSQGYYVYSGRTEAVNAGTYTVTLNLREGYMWEDQTLERKSFTYTIAPQQISLPQNPSVEFNYREQTILEEGLRESVTVESGTIKAKNAGEYNAVLSLKENYIWNDGTTEDKPLYWTITKARAAVIDIQNFTYNGKEQGYMAKNGWSFKDSPDCIYRATDAGVYTFVCVLDENHTWWDGSTEDWTMQWSISPQRVLTPTKTEETLIYNGKAQSGVRYQENMGYSIGGVLATDAGTHTATFTLDKNHCWDYPYETLNLEWTIEKKVLKIPQNIEENIVYNGALQECVLYGGELGVAMKEGNVWQKEAGKYEVTVYIEDTVNYIWENGDANAEFSYSFIIYQAQVAAPTPRTGLTYNGAEQTGIEYDSNLLIMEEEGDLCSGINAGKYYCNFSLKDAKNYKWQMGTYPNALGVATVVWEIAKAENFWTEAFSMNTIRMEYNDELGKYILSYYVGEAITPMAKAAFGEVEFRYVDRFDLQDSPFNVPIADSGHTARWKMYAVVQETENYTGLKTELVDFMIRELPVS